MANAELQRRTRAKPRGVLVTAVVSILAAALAVVYAVDSSASVNGWKLPLQDRRWVVSLAPQGWNFFTRDPQEPRIEVYRRDGDAWVSVDPGSSAEPRYLFGFSRQARVLGMETGAVLKGVRGTPPWQECRSDPAQCLAASALPEPVWVPNDSPHPILCGAVAFVRRPPVPWAWSNSRVPTVMPSSFFRANVQCSDA